MMLAPMAQAPPKAGAKELWYSLNLIHEFRSLFCPKVIFVGKLTHRRCLCGHECFSVVAQATAKICPKPAQGLSLNERT